MQTLLCTAPLDFALDLKSKIQAKFNLVYKNQASLDKTIALLRESDPVAWICNPCPSYYIDSSLLTLAPRLRTVVTPSTGTNHIDVKFATDNNILISSLRNSNAVQDIVASSEFTFTLMLSVIRKLPLAQSIVHSNGWRNVEHVLRARELKELTLGIVGCGRIGSNLAKYSAALGMKIYSCDPFLSDTHKSDPIRSNITFLSNMYEVASISDVVCICVHLDDSTRKMIDKQFFDSMKPGSVFINTSRGDVVNEDDLLLALQSNRLSAAGLDVLSHEEKLPSYVHPLIEFSKNDPRLTITPHIAGLTIDSEVKAQTYAFEAVLGNLATN